MWWDFFFFLQIFDTLDGEIQETWDDGWGTAWG
jgi:hypothetical protein